MKRFHLKNIKRVKRLGLDIEDMCELNLYFYNFLDKILS